MQISRSSSFSTSQVLLIVFNSINSLSSSPLSKQQIAELKVRDKAGEDAISFWENGQHIVCRKLSKGTTGSDLEKARKVGSDALAMADQIKATEIAVYSLVEDQSINAAILEGSALSSYRFDRHLSKKASLLVKKIKFVSGELSSTSIKELNALCDAVFFARDLVNEPLNHMTAKDLANAAKKAGKKAGFQVEVFNKQKIQALKMGGLLSVNLGSPDPPTFSIMKWTPPKALNEKPVVLIGKGVVYDTGGLSLKPTPNSMDKMKCDMAGSAAVIGAMYAIASMKLPLKVIGLVPATDNRPGSNAYVPGDVIKMHNGKTVEVLNTDAEGRLILADALSYAEKFDPELVIDLATLTGSAAHALGTKGSVAMGNAPDKVFKALANAGEGVYERIARFPFWEEYDDELKSDIADMKNIGGPTGGAITAGKFLARFTTKPHVHIDIAGTAFLDATQAYRTKGGTGVGVRLIYQTLKDLYDVGE